MKMREKTAPLFFLFLLSALLLFSGSALAKEQYVYDQAGLLDGGEEKELASLAVRFGEESHMNFVVMTVEDAKGLDEAGYADGFYEERGYIENGKKGGAIFYIDMDNRAVGMETEGDMILFLTDRRIEKAIDRAYPYVESQNYAKALEALMETTARYIQEGIENGQVTYNEDTGEYRKYRSVTPLEALIAFLIAAAAGAAACGAVAVRYRRKDGANSYDFRTNGSLKLELSEDVFSGQHVTRRHIPRDNGGGGGGPISTTHNSAGGHEFGGGSRKF